MTNWKVDSKDDVLFVQKVTVKYLSVLKADGLVGLMNLVMEEGHDYTMWCSYNEATQFESDAPFILKCNSAGLCRKAMAFVLDSVRWEYNDEYVIRLSDVALQSNGSLTVLDDLGRGWKIDVAIHDLG